MNTASTHMPSLTGRSSLPPYVILGLIVISTLILATSLSGLHIGTGTTGYSAPALFNAGNAAAQQGKTGLAIVNYERAKLLAPNDSDIAANLTFIRDKANLTTPAPTWLDRTTSWASPNTMALLGWLGLVLTGVGLLAARHSARHRLSSRLVALAGIALLSLSALSALNAIQKSKVAVILPPDASARISPVTTADVAFKLKSGQTVSIEGHYNDFLLVKTRLGKTGWLPQSDLTPLIPR